MKAWKRERNGCVHERERRRLQDKTGGRVSSGGRSAIVGSTVPAAADTGE